MPRVKTFTNGGSLLPGDLNAMEDDYEYAFSNWHVLTFQNGFTGGLGAATWVLAGVFDKVQSPSINGGIGLFYIDPADHPANTRQVKCRVRAFAACNSTGSSRTYTIGLYPVTGVGGGDNKTSVTLGTVVLNSTVAFTAPVANSASNGATPSFNMPAAGYYVLAVAITGGSEPGTTQIMLRARLDVSWV